MVQCRFDWHRTTGVQRTETSLMNLQGPLVSLPLRYPTDSRNRLRQSVLSVALGLMLWACCGVAFGDQRPNILIAMSDDVSYPHKSAYGSEMVSSPVFDRVAREGVLFQNAFCPAPGCSPSRAAFLTGRHIWMIEEAGTHASYFQKKYETFPERLAAAGYFVGSTGKAWGPGNFKHNGREHNPAGPAYSNRKASGKYRGYAAGFEKFLAEKPQDQPFCFWFGSTDAHRGYKKGSGLAKGKELEQAEVPGFLPDHPEIRSDLLDYAFEIERFDSDCGLMLDQLEAAGELDNTLVIITSDNGMPFPRAKANCYEYGVHMPLAIRWPQAAPGGRVWEDLIGFVDLTATIYAAAGVEPPTEFPVVGRSFLDELKSDKAGRVDPTRQDVVFGRERHSSSRYNSLSYPQRAIRTDKWLYIRNFMAHRWPAGPARKFDKAVYDQNNQLVQSVLGPLHGGYHDIDACPSLTFLYQNAEHPEFGMYLDLAVAKRPEEELFDITVDPACLNNLAGDADHRRTKNMLRQRLQAQLETTGDARVGGNGDVWESYPRISRLRWFPEPEWLRKGIDQAPPQPWVDARRPRRKEKD